MKLGLVGKKIGMTREFFNSGISVPVTVVKIEKGRVIDVYTKEKNGYSAVKLGFVKIKNSKLTNQMKGFFAKKNTEPQQIIKEYRVEKTIGKGFAGVMKKYNFGGLRASHGVSVSHRSHGSTGQNQDPGKVFKNKKMAGHMGSKFRTILNLEVIRSDIENSLIYIKGSIPGSKNSLIYLRKSKKTFSRKTSIEKYAQLSKETEKTTTKKTEPKKKEEKKDTTKEQPKKK